MNLAQKAKIWAQTTFFRERVFLQTQKITKSPCCFKKQEDA